MLLQNWIQVGRWVQRQCGEGGGRSIQAKQVHRRLRSDGDLSGFAALICGFSGFVVCATTCSLCEVVPEQRCPGLDGIPRWLCTPLLGIQGCFMQHLVLASTQDHYGSWLCHDSAPGHSLVATMTCTQGGGWGGCQRPREESTSGVGRLLGLGTRLPPPPQGAFGPLLLGGGKSRTKARRRPPRGRPPISGLFDKFHFFFLRKTFPMWLGGWVRRRIPGSPPPPGGVTD